MYVYVSWFMYVYVDIPGDMYMSRCMSMLAGTSSPCGVFDRLNAKLLTGGVVDSTMVCHAYEWGSNHGQ